MDWITDAELFCCTCSSRFHIKENLHHPKLAFRFPYYMPCGHSTCVKCICSLRVVGNHETKKSLTCKVCLTEYKPSAEEAPLIAKNDAFTAVFPPNLYYLGILYYSTFARANPRNQDAIRKIIVSKREIMSSAKKLRLEFENAEKKCGNCNVGRGTKCFCAECSQIFCENCFATVHAFQFNKSHRKLPLTMELMCQKIGKCRLHPAYDVQMYCNDCDKYVCAECTLSLLCSDHNFQAINDKHRDNLIKLQTLRPKISYMINCTLKSIANLKAGFTMNAPGAGSKAMENKLMQDFGKASSVVQLEQIRIMKKYREHQVKSRADHEGYVDTLTTNQEKLEELIDSIDIALSDGSLRIQTSPLVQMATKALTMPCKVIQDAPGPPLNFEIGNVSLGNCSISSTDDAGPTSTIQVLPLSREEIPDVVMSEASSDVIMQSLEMDHESVSSTTDVAPKIANLTVGTIEPVVLTHTCNPHEFYVRRLSQNDSFNQMSANLKQNPPPICDADKIVQSKMYAVYEAETQEWYRVTIIRREPLPKDADKANLKFKVKYVDFGHKENVLATAIGELTAEIMAIAPYALQCFLPCRPIGSKWTEESINLMGTILNGQEQVSIMVLKLSQISYEVELFTNPDSPGESPVGVARSLLFLGHALHARENQIDRFNWPVRIEQPLFKKDISLKTNDEVYITSVTSPNLFHVRQVEFDGIFSNMKTALNSQFTFGNVQDKGMLYDIKRDMCVACYSDKLQWCRGKVMYAKNRNEISVYFVDFGNIEVVPWSNLRKLPAEFYEVSELAINCKLAGLPPVLKRKHTEALTFMQKAANSWAPSTIKVEKESSGIYEVILTVPVEDKLIVVNEAFISNGFVVSPGSDKIEYPVANVQAVKVCTEEEGGKIQKKKRNRKKNVNPLALALTNIQNRPAKIERAEDDLKVYVKIIRAESPSVIYITFLKEEDNLSNLYSKMKAHYDEVDEIKGDWKVDDTCAVFCSEQKIWHRAIITNIDQQMATIFSKDIAKEERVHFDNLRPLQEEFLTVADGAIKCHMDNIIPACGNKWPNLTCQYLDELVTAWDKFYVEQDGDVKDRSLPIKLWVYVIEDMGALEPTVEEWRQVNRMIVAKGLAVRTAMDEDDDVDMGEAEEEQMVLPETSMDSSLPVIAKRIADWLPARTPTAREFLAIPTFVDDDFNIYMQLLDLHRELITVMDLIEAADYRNQPPAPEDMFWAVGQPCVAQYSKDDTFYRARVKAISETTNTISVVFVDYGNVEECHVSKLRKNVVAEDVPLQVLKIRVPGVKPKRGKKWDQAMLDYVHTQIVEKRCRVKLLGKDAAGVIYGFLKVENGHDLLDLPQMQTFVSQAAIPLLNPIGADDDDGEDDDEPQIQEKDDDDDIICVDDY